MRSKALGSHLEIISQPIMCFFSSKRTVTSRVLFQGHSPQENVFFVLLACFSYISTASARLSYMSFLVHSGRMSSKFSKVSAYLMKKNRFD